MPRVLDTFEFPHGGRKGMEYDFESLCDGQIYQLDTGVDFPNDGDTPTASAETFLGALSRYANKKGLRVRKDISEDGMVVTVNVNPKKVKEESSDNGATDADAKAVAAGKRAAAKK